MKASGNITALYRYPVKGMSAEEMPGIALQPGECVEWDRAFAIENGSHDFDPAAPKHFSKSKFLMLMRDERLANLASRFDTATTTLMLAEKGKEVARGDLTSAQGRTAIEEFIASYMKADLRGAPRIVHAPGFSHSDAPYKLLSIINLATLRELETHIGRPIDPLRFRANVYVDGLPAWLDHEWIGKDLRLGSATLKGFHKIPRCAATNVDPATGARDMEIPKTLQRIYDSVDLGIYAQVTGAGAVCPGDQLAPA